MAILLQKDTTFGSNVKTNYHRTKNFRVDVDAGTVLVQVASYESQAAHAADAAPLSQSRHTVPVNMLKVLVEGDVGKTLWDINKEALEAGLLTLPEFEGGVVI